VRERIEHLAPDDREKLTMSNASRLEGPWSLDQDTTKGATSRTGRENKKQTTNSAAARSVDEL
jgi:hypothetical protein